MCPHCDGRATGLFDTSKYVFPQIVAREAHNILPTLTPTYALLGRCKSIKFVKQIFEQSKSKKGAMLLSVATLNRWTTVRVRSA
jgi:hypothetical protein